MADSTPYSRYRHTDLIIRDGIETYGVWKRPDFMNRENLSQEDIVQISIDQHNAGRPDIIASELYGIITLEWIIVMFNRPLNPLGWPIAGVTIEAPDPDVVFRGL